MNEHYLLKYLTIFNIFINNDNIKLKQLDYLYQQKVKEDEEKEQRRIERERIAEEEKIRKEFEKEQERIEEEERRYARDLELLAQQEKEFAQDKEQYASKIKELEDKLKELEETKEENKKRSEVSRAGYVYVVSNIGSFGENIFKIGMTRRYDPYDRIKELSGASVPFEFDVHAMIYSDDAPSLEKELHHHFKKQAVNKINYRKEFFNVALDEIEKVVHSYYDPSVKFVTIPEASQYRKTLEIEQHEK